MNKRNPKFVCIQEIIIKFPMRNLKEKAMMIMDFFK